MINLGDPLISPNSPVNSYVRTVASPLILIAASCGKTASNTVQLVDKAILLLKRNADISCRDRNGDTVLHLVLRCPRHHERNRMSPEGEFYISLTELNELLMVFITAGADVCAINDEGETPSKIAQDYGWKDEWTKALTLCGYDSEDVFARSGPTFHDSTHIPQISVLSFEEFCQNRQEHLRYKKICFGEYCQGCGEKFRHEMMSFEERCRQCGESLQARTVSLGGHYQTWRESYLLEKTSYTRYYQKFLGSLIPENKETIGTDDESDEDGYTEISGSDESSEDVDIGGRYVEQDTEITQRDDKNCEDFEGSGCDAQDMDIDLEEVEVLNHDPMQDVSNQRLEDGDREGVGLAGTDLNNYGLMSDDMDIFRDFCDFSNCSDIS